MKREFGCLMINFDDTPWSNFLNEFIDREDIYDDETHDYGLEHEPHVTVLYGLHDDEFDYGDLKQMLPKLNDITISLKNISFFTGDKYDVVKFNINSKDLITLNKQITEKFPYSTDFPIYHPHTTIAYVKKGTGYKYIDPKKEIVMGIDCYKYGFKSGDNDYFLK